MITLLRKTNSKSLTATVTYSYNCSLLKNIIATVVKFKPLLYQILPHSLSLVMVYHAIGNISGMP